MHRTLVFAPLMGRRSRYLIVACLCAASHNVIMIAGNHSRVGYLVMTLVSFMILTPTAYALHTRFTFAEQFSVERFLRFASGTAVGLPLSLLAMAILCTLMKLPVFVAAPITTVTLFVWNYASTHLSILGASVGTDANQVSGLVGLSQTRKCQLTTALDDELDGD